MGRNIEIAIILGLFALCVFVIFPATVKFTNCFSTATGQISELTNNPPKTKELFCQNGQRVDLELIKCIDNAKKENFMSPLLYKLGTKFSNYQKTTEILVRHNKMCPNNQVPEAL